MLAIHILEIYSGVTATANGIHKCEFTNVNIEYNLLNYKPKLTI